MKRTVKRLFSMTMCVFLLLSLLPVGVLATPSWDLKLYCQAPADWDQCKIYWWGSTVANPSWPGVDMTLEENGLWSASIPEDAGNVIFHDGNGIQSPDLQVPPNGEDVYIFEQGYWSGYGPCPCPPVWEYYVAGEAALCGVEWLPGAPQNKMTAGADGTYSKTYTGVAAGSYQLKVTTDTWENSWGADGDTWNYVVTVEQDNSTVVICFDPETKIISSSVLPGSVPDSEAYYLVGFINDEIYGYEEDSENMGIYRFEDGKLTVNFTRDSYVFLKTEGNEKWLRCPVFCGTSTGTFSEDGTEMMWIPGNVELTLCLEEYPDGSVTLSYEWPSDAAIIDAAYRLAEGQMMEQTVTLTGEIISVDTSYSPQYKNITVTISVPGSEDQPIRCFRLKGDGADTLWVGDTITVSGNLMNYKGTVEFMQGCELEFIPCPPPVPPISPTPEEIVDAAYGLGPGESLPYTVMLWGRITEIVTPYDKDYKNITVNIVVHGRESKPLVCYRLGGDGTDILKVGDIITVEGNLRHYVKTDSETGAVLRSSIEFSPCTLVGVSPAGQIALYCQVPQNWSQCYVYSWDDEGYSMSGDWPGTLMTRVEDDLWSCEVPATADHLIFNNGNGGANDHTGDLDIPADGRILYVVDDQSWEQWLIGDDPDLDGWGPDSLALVGNGIPGIPAWYPEAPEGDMVQVSDNVYEKILYCPTGTSMFFKIVGNDQWGDMWHFGGTNLVLEQEVPLDQGPGAQDMWLEIAEPCTLRFTVDLNGMRDGGNATLLVENLDAPDPISPRGLTVIVPASWTSVYAYTWEPEEFGSYPGAALQKSGDAYKATVKNSMVNLVLSGSLADGTFRQTCDISLEPNGKDATVTVAEDGSFTVSYGSPVISSYRVVGNASWMGNWDPASSEGQMEEEAPGIYRKHFENVQPGSYEFKITKNGKWDNAIGGANGNNYCFKVWETCDLLVVLVPESGEVIVSLDGTILHRGDVTGDCKLNLGDMAKLYAHIRGSALLTGPGTLCNADFTGDGNINIGDAARLYSYLRATDQTTVVDAAYGLAENQQLPTDSTLTGEVIEVLSPYDFETHCITVRIAVPGRENNPILCTRLTGVETELIALGDIITVTGRIRNFYGVVEFKEGCRLVAWEDFSTPVETLGQIVDAAYELGRNETMDHSVTLRGYVTSIDDAYTAQMPYISVTIEVFGREDKPISCYRMLGEQLYQVKVGGVLTVSGTLRNFNGIVEFTEGCQMVEYFQAASAM